MKNNWQTKKLGEILKLEYGKPLSKEDRNTDGSYPVYGANGEKDRSNKFYFDRPSIIVGRKGSAGEVNLTESKFWPLDVTYFVIFDEASYDLKFLYLLLKSLDLPNLAKGVKPGINRHDIYKINVITPPLPEQKRLVALLDDVFAKIEKAKINAEKNLKNAKEVFESYLEAVFSKSKNNWDKKKLKDITNKIGSGATPKGGSKNYKLEGLSLIRSMNVHDLKFKNKNLALIDNNQAKELDNVSVQEFDILFNITGASVARSCIVPIEYLPARVNQHVSIIRAKRELIDPHFLNLMLVSKFYKDKLLTVGEQGATRQAITKAQLENFEINFPPSLSEQKSIVSHLSALSTETKKLESIYQKKLACLEELKKSILGKAFRGEL